MSGKGAATRKTGTRDDTPTIGLKTHRQEPAPSSGCSTQKVPLFCGGGAANAVHRWGNFF